MHKKKRKKLIRLIGFNNFGPSDMAEMPRRGVKTYGLRRKIKKIWKKSGLKIKRVFL